MYQALYRKYRPTSFDDVVGQEHITQTLRNEIIAGKPSHAYLLMGSRGTGKTTCAKLIAKAVNCLNPQNGSPCGECEMCRGIDNGSIMDVLEIDAASNNGVDNIRDLREEANFLPAAAKYRVYIIDEAHMLSVGAVNALLKIMEEPPEHVIFILATTEVHKMPATIQSRCQRFDFKRIGTEQMSKRLETICINEGFTFESEALTMISRLAEGGMRDAISMLDLCASHSKDITAMSVQLSAGLVAQDYLFEITDAIISSDVSRLYEIIANVNDAAVEYDRLCQQLITHFRNLMVVSTVQKPENMVICSSETLLRYSEQAKKYSVSKILYGISILQDCAVAMKKSSSRRFEMEMSLIKICDPRLSSLNEGLVTRIENLEAKLNYIIANGIKTENDSTSEVEERRTPTNMPVSPKPNSGTQSQPAPKPSITPKNDDTPAVPMENWSDILERLKALNPALRGVLLTSSAYIKGRFVLIDCNNPLFVDMINSSEITKNTLKQAIVEVTGRKYHIGPYKKSKPDLSATENKSNLDKILELAAQNGVDIKEI